ncbi:MAG TPA: phospholipid carrier-dependent glycosyltransferase [Candidatus Limnocylindria bacterium]
MPGPRADAAWSRLDWAALVAVTLGAAAVRLAGLSRPVGFVFDEIFYVQNACRYVIDTAACGTSELASRAHPPLGNWLIGAGVKLFGYDEFGWRVMVALAGTLGVALLFVLVRHLLRAAAPRAATAGAFVAAGLLAGDFLHLVMSRVGMLDAFLTLFIIAAVLFAVLDRDRPRPARWERRSGGVLSALALGRPWRLLAGAAIGAAAAVKWSGLYVAFGVVPLVVAWEIAARRETDDPAAGYRRWRDAAWLAVREEGPRTLVLLGVVPLLVYLASYIGRMPGELIGAPWQEGTAWRGIWDHQQAMLAFHTELAGHHPYESPPWSWLLLKRPVALYFQADGGAFRQILAFGSPLAWAAGLAAFGWTTVRLARAGWGLWRPELVVLVAALAVYLPWLALSGDRTQTFIWYALPALPFLYAAGGLSVAWAWRRTGGRVATGAVLAGCLALLVFFLPVLTALPLEPDAWRGRMWLTACERPGAVTITLPDDEINEGPPPSGWCWI